VSVEGLGIRGTVKMLRLAAPGELSKTDVRLGGAAVDEHGRWRAERWERVSAGDLELAKMSAVVIRS
jgi:hypothetical protein